MTTPGTVCFAVTDACLVVHLTTTTTKLEINVLQQKTVNVVYLYCGSSVLEEETYLPH